MTQVIACTERVKSEIVDINEINLQPGPFCMSFGYKPDILIQSIKRVGLLNPPLLKRNPDQKWDIILGFKRIKALECLRWEEIPCNTLQEGDLTPLQCLLISLHDNLATRHLNAVEKAMVLSRLSRWVTKDEILRDYMPLLGISSNEPSLEFYCKLDLEVQDQIKSAIAAERLSLTAAKKIIQMDKDAQYSIFGLLTSLMFNFNQQRNLIDFLIDLSQNEKKSIASILNEDSIQKIVTDGSTNNPQKIAALLRFLRSQCFPKLTDAEDTFNNMISRLDLPKGVTINAPPFFESPLYRMEIRFRNGEELQAKVNQLEVIKGLSAIHDPWENDTK